MIVIRYTFRPSKDWSKVRDLLVEWRDKHPEEHMRIYNSITGHQQVLVLEEDLPDDDVTGIANTLFEPQKHASAEEREWWKKVAGLDADWESREVWRLV